MDVLEQRVNALEKDVEDFKRIWKLLSTMERQLAVIESKLREGHPCKQEKEIQSLKDFKYNAQKTIDNSIGKNQAIIMIIFTALLGALLGYISRGL